MKNYAIWDSFNSLLKWVLLITILSAVVLLLLPPGNRLSKIQIEQFQSDTQLKGIARLVFTYKSQHRGNLPPSLSELVPNDRTDLLNIFYAPNAPESARPAGWSTNKIILVNGSVLTFYTLSSSFRLAAGECGDARLQRLASEA